jgi:hypothetical protein
VSTLDQQATSTAASTAPSTAAEQLWARFPVDAVVRPLVFPMGPIAEPPDGYTTDDAKMAGGSATFTLPATLPVMPATVDGHEILAADKALAMARVTDGTNPGQPITASDVRLGQAEFTTDRGPKNLPAWLITIPGATAPIALVAVGGPTLFHPGTPILSSDTSLATVDASDTTVTLGFVGAAEGTGPCTADYKLTVIEHPTFVETVVVTTRDGGGICLAMGYGRQASASLTKAHGARVLIEQKTGAPIIVTHA